MLDLALATFILIIPFVYWEQTSLIRIYPLVFFSGIIACGFLFYGSMYDIEIIYDTSTIFMLVFAGWLVASISWTDSTQSIHELYSWLAILFLCYLCRYADYPVILAVIMSVGFCFSVMSILLKYTTIIKVDHIHGDSYIFGNREHNATFAIIPLFISLWAASFNPLWLVVTSVIGYQLLFVARTAGAVIAVLAGLLFVLFTISKVTFGFAFVVLPLGFWVFVKRNPQWWGRHQPALTGLKGKKYSIIHRLIYWKASWNIIKKRYLFGHGLNMFRKLYPEENPNLLKDEKISNFLKTWSSSGIEAGTGHRCHNDLIEIVIELGFVGLVFFLGMFTGIDWFSIHPVLIGGILSYLIMAMIFFPLREVHTAVPFWAMVGVLMGKGTVYSILLEPVVAFMVILVIFRVMFATSIKLLGLYFYHQTQAIPDIPENIELRRAFIQSAIGCDPYCAKYLMWGVLLHGMSNPDIAFQYALRQVAYFDGGKVKWGVYDQFARMALRFSGINIAKMYALKALRIHPGFEKSNEVLRIVAGAEQQILKKMEEDAACQAT